MIYSRLQKAQRGKGIAMLFALILALQLVTTAFHAQAPLPASMAAADCGGANRSPDLSWSGAPSRTKSFALLLHDPDAPRAGGFYHWVLYDMPPTMKRLDAGAESAVKYAGQNSTGGSGYYGPCPPPGKPHHYVFTLYALDVPNVGATSPLTAEELLDRIRGHVLAQSSITGTYQTR
jgi:Raf kinase inhibitor-like YbhB/YbcL family protein